MGKCEKRKRLLATVGEMKQLQIKCSRCGTLDPVRATSPELSPLSDMNADPPQKIIQLKGNHHERS
ncbi:Com family DNA-binding transcriptional regulator [Pseudomonas graminis]|uniref:Com family DNA-binding transcriptional regulator n=1 Tax=Pseudomonas graminis TaxID=158627 RepID=UPI0023496704|nr:Com family DNA-binding transcriptional regulator [Pseudomonas graminis]MDC6383013.1 Com family DNA-binding transcriptional regulator [Pseudomonas graminis]